MGIAADREFELQIIQVLPEEHAALFLETYKNKYSKIGKYDLISGKRLAGYRYPASNNCCDDLNHSYIWRQIDDQVYFATSWYLPEVKLCVYNQTESSYRCSSINAPEELLDATDIDKLNEWWNGSRIIKSPRFHGMQLYGKDIYLTPGSYPGIVRYDIQNNIIEVYTDFVEKICLAADSNGGRKSFALSNSVLVGDNLFIACQWVDGMLQFDLKNKKGELIKFSDNTNGNSHIVAHNDLLLIVSSDGTMWTEYDITKGVICKRNDLLCYFPEGVALCRTVSCGNMILTVCEVNGEKKLYEYDSERGCLEKNGFIHSILTEREQITSCICHMGILFLLTNMNRIIRVKGKEVIDSTVLLPDQACLNELRASCFDHEINWEGVVYENTGVQLKELIGKAMIG